MAIKNKNKKILFFCSYQAVYGGNFIPSLIALEERIKQTGNSCIYIFPTAAGTQTWFKQMQTMGKHVYTFNFNQSRYKLIKELASFVKQNNISLIHSHFASILPLEIFAFLHRNIKVIIHLHSDFSLGKKSIKIKIKNFILYKMFAHSVFFISVSKAFVNYNPKKIVYVPNALASDRLLCKHYSREEIRQKYNVKENEILCEIFGWTPYVKGVDVAVEAMKLLNKEQNIYKLAIICGREITTEKMPDWISKNTSCTGQEKFLIYLPPIEDVFAYHNASDILISASRSEGFPYSILEMLSLGKNCVISDIPGVEWAKKYSCSFIFPQKDFVTCANLVRNIYKNKNLFPDEKTSLEIKQVYSINSWTKRNVEYYNI